LNAASLFTSKSRQFLYCSTCDFKLATYFHLYTSLTIFLRLGQCYSPSRQHTHTKDYAMDHQSGQIKSKQSLQWQFWIVSEWSLVHNSQSKTRYRAQSDVSDDSVCGITAVDCALNLCVSESEGTRRETVGDAGVNGVDITYVTKST